MTAASLDGAGVIGLGVTFTQLENLEQSNYLIKLLLLLTVIYISFGWLFGSYSMLRVTRLSWAQSMARLGSTTIASIAAAVLIGYLFKLNATSTLFFRSSLLPMFLSISVWSALVRLMVRQDWGNQQRYRWRIMALSQELEEIETEWHQNQYASQIVVFTDLNEFYADTEADSYKTMAISSGVINDPTLQGLCQKAMDKGIRISSLVELAEQELQRIPPRWVSNQWMLFSSRIEGSRNTLQKQLKRYADVLISLILLIPSSPLILIASLLVKLQDGGPVLYRQQRTGLLGQPFEIFKIRTMTTSAEESGAQWSQINDQRITRVGRWLRRTRLDELPQLLNVLRGDMSLVGPRPERPQLEVKLEEAIPNYRLRHWIRPGLSGWAQVNMPYSSNIKEAELKLSYDLYYLSNSNIWLDLLILFKTIKVILKATGR